jgi:hypothetical protein
MFLSLVCAPNDVGAPLARETFAQRFNVAASRARDRMYLVRSVEAHHLAEGDRLRRGLLAHFAAPFPDEAAVGGDARDLCESPLERDIYDWLLERGYRVRPQLRVGAYRIDLVVEGDNDARLAIECDGDKYHGADKWAGSACSSAPAGSSGAASRPPSCAGATSCSKTLQRSSLRAASIRRRSGKRHRRRGVRQRPRSASSGGCACRTLAFRASGSQQSASRPRPDRSRQITNVNAQTAKALTAAMTADMAGTGSAGRER